MRVDRALPPGAGTTAGPPDGPPDGTGDVTAAAGAYPVSST
jgi:hypothetical protein